MSMPSFLRLLLHVGSGSTSLIALVSVCTTGLGRRGRDGNAVPARDLEVLDAALHARSAPRADRRCASGPVEASATTLLSAISPCAAVKNSNIDVDIAAQQRGAHVGGGAERHDRHLDAGGAAEQFGGEILRAAGIDGADVELARIGLRRLDDVLHRFQRRAGSWSRSAGRRTTPSRSRRSPSGCCTAAT